MAINDSVTHGFHVATKPLLWRDSDYDWNDLAGWHYASCSVGDRIFLFWTSSWYEFGVIQNGHALVGWRIFDIDLDTGDVTETDSWANYKQTFVSDASQSYPDFPLAGVQDNTSEFPNGDLRVDEDGGYYRRNFEESLRVIGENSEYHWLGLYYVSTYSGSGGSALMVMKVRKSDGKLFTSDGTPGFPSASDGEDIRVSQPGMIFGAPLMGPFRTSQGIVVGSVATRFPTPPAASIEYWSLVYPFDDELGITGGPIDQNTGVIADTDNGPILSGDYGGDRLYFRLVDDIIVCGHSYETYGQSVDRTLVYTFDSSGAFVDIKSVLDGRAVQFRPYSTMVVVEGGVVISGKFSDYSEGNYNDEGIMLDVPVEISQAGIITAGTSRPWPDITGQINFSGAAGTTYPPYLICFSDTAGRGGVGGLQYGAEDPDGTFGGYRVVDLEETVYERVTAGGYYEQAVDPYTYPGLPVDTGATFYPYNMQVPYNALATESRDAFGPPIGGRYCYSINLDGYRTTEDIAGSSDLVEVLYLAVWEVYQSPFRFAGFGTEIGSSNMYFDLA